MVVSYFGFMGFSVLFFVFIWLWVFCYLCVALFFSNYFYLFSIVFDRLSVAFSLKKRLTRDRNYFTALNCYS